VPNDGDAYCLVVWRIKHLEDPSKRLSEISPNRTIKKCVPCPGAPEKDLLRGLGDHPEICLVALVRINKEGVNEHRTH
jgi:hypothetical protein